jgi:hypothetical protein
VCGGEFSVVVSEIKNNNINRFKEVAICLELISPKSVRERKNTVSERE